MYADLHIHSWYSDGTLTPAEIIEKARSQNVTLISICDHNTIDAYHEIGSHVEARSSWDTAGIRIIPGAEVTAMMNDVEYHILAYGFDMQDKGLSDLFTYNRSVNADMGTKLIEKMAKDYPVSDSKDYPMNGSGDYPLNENTEHLFISLEEFASFQRNRRNGGWESIDYLRSKGLVASWDDFSKIVRKYGSPPKNDFLHPSEVIKIIHDAGGHGVLAHLCHYEKSSTSIADYEKRAMQFIDMGIDGFECYYPAQAAELTEALVKLCRQHDLIITAGGDDHGGFIGAPGDEYYIGAVKIAIQQLSLRSLDC